MPAVFLSRVRRVTLTFAALTALTSCGDSATGPSNPAKETFAASLDVNLASMTRKSDNLYIQDLVVGSGAEAIVGRTLGMNYTGWLVNGTQFDSNVGSATFTFTLGARQVIDGWDQGIQGMKVGGRRRIVMGSELGYGSRGQGVIPPNATLVFVVELKTLQ